MTRWSAGSPTRVWTSSTTSTRNRWAAPPGSVSAWSPAPIRSQHRSGRRPRPPGRSAWRRRARRWGRPRGRRSRCGAPAAGRGAGRGPCGRNGIMPSHSSPSVKLASIPLIRGEPSRRRVARTLCLWASKAALALAASSGADASISPQLAMRMSLRTLDKSGVVGDCVAIPSRGERDDREQDSGWGRPDRPAVAGRGQTAPVTDRHGTVARRGRRGHPGVGVEDPPPGERPGRLQGTRPRRPAGPLRGHRPRRDRRRS